MKERLRHGGKAAAKLLTGVGSELEQLRERVAVLEEEVQECRQLNLRLAELTDVVGELLLPAAQRDDTGVTEALERYRKGL